MQWKPLETTSRDITIAATGETLRTVASFQGHDGHSDILRAHLAVDGEEIVLLTEYEDAAGKRALGRTTQWPREVLYHCLNRPTADFFNAVDSEPAMLDAGDEPMIYDPNKGRMVGAEEAVRDGKLTRGQADEAYRSVGSEPPTPAPDGAVAHKESVQEA